MLGGGVQKLLTGWEMTGLSPVPSAGPVGLGGVTVVVVVSVSLDMLLGRWTGILLMTRLLVDSAMAIYVYLWCNDILAAYFDHTALSSQSNMDMGSSWRMARWHLVYIYILVSCHLPGVHIKRTIYTFG